MATSNDHLEEMIRCSVCLECPESKPIYQCNQGHVHCVQCHPHLVSCPMCREEIINVRALVAEQIMEQLLKNCKHAGCKVKKIDIEKHETNCEFESEIVECANSGCDDLISKKDIEKHAKVCNFEVIQCLGCDAGILRKDLTRHHFIERANSLYKSQ